MFNDFIDEFKNYKKTFEPTQGADAREFRSNQSLYWKSLANAAVEDANKSDRGSNFSIQIKDIFDTFQKFVEELFTVEQKSDNSFVVRGLIPLLNDNSHINLYARRNLDVFLGAVFAELSIASINNPLISEYLSDHNILGSSRYNAISAMYISEKAIASEGSISETKLLNSQSKQLLSSLDEYVNVYRAMTERLGSEYNSKIGSIGKEFDDALQKMRNDASAQIEARLNAQHELNKIRRPVELWSKAATRHRRWFWAGLICLLTIVLGISAYVIEIIVPSLTNLGFVKGDIAQPFTPASTLTLAMMIALIAAAGFVLKILGRFITNALTLAEDAEVRAALADTFIGLTAEDTQASDLARDQARTVMLAALFRPLPGHQQEDITAPTVLSLAQDLLGKKSS